MEVQLSNFSFPLPFPDIHTHERKIIEKFHQSRVSDTKMVLSEVKMSSRQMIIFISYLLTQLLTSQQQQKNYFYLCKTEQRKKQLSYSARKLLSYISNWLSIKKQKTSTVDVRITDEVDQDKNMRQNSLKYTSSNYSHHLFILTSRTYFQHKIYIKQMNYWNSTIGDQYYLHVDNDLYAGFHKYMKKTDGILLQTNDYQGLLEDSLSVQLSEIIIQRGSLECMKLYKYYNIKFGSKSAQKQINDFYDKKFQKLFEEKISKLQRKSTGGYVSANQTAKAEFLQVQFLLYLQQIYYICNYLMTQGNKIKFQETQRVEDYLANIQDIKEKDRFQGIRPGLKRDSVKKLRKILDKMLQKYPPKIRDKQLSSFYLRQILLFFQKVVIWSQIFIQSKKNEKFMVLRYLKELNPSSKIQSNNLKVNREQHIKLTTFDQQLIYELLGDPKKIWCFQNNFYEQDYCRDNILMKLPVKPQIWNAQIIGQSKMKSRSIGMIVNSTANDQNMKINSYKFTESKQQNLDADEKKQLYQHYWQNIRTYGVMIYDLCDIVPDGIVVYFPSRHLLREYRAEWEERQNIYEKIVNKKKVFQESQFQVENILKIAEYRKLCNLGRGAIFFVSAQSQFSKYQSFFNHYSRCIVFVGVPYPTNGQEVETKLRTMGLSIKDPAKKQAFCFQWAMRIVNRCLCNCINDSCDLKLVVLADADYRNTKIKKWLPFIDEVSLNNVTLLQSVMKSLR